VRLGPGPEGPSRGRVVLLQVAAVGGAVLVWLAARRHHVVISDLERQPVGPPELESLDIPPELEP
jgi:hypothetical protein